MQKIFKTDFSVVLLILVIFACILPFFFLHQGLLTLDTGREFYLSQQVSQGGILYRDIFNIYGPFSYQFNALLFSLFGESINTLYIAGIINSVISLIAMYFLSREFLNKRYSFLITIFMMFSLVFTTYLFTSNMSYSYGLMYGLSSLLISMVCLIKYMKCDNIIFAYISCLFAGLTVINKYEFILYPIILLYVFIFFKPLELKNKIKSIVCFLIFPLVSFSILFIQGLTITDLFNAIKLMGIMANSDSIKLFYSMHGCFFELNNYMRVLLKNPVYMILGLLPIINIVLFIAFIKKIYENKALFVFCLVSICTAIKFTLFLEVDHMGAFFLPLCFLTTFILLSDKLNESIKFLTLIILILFFASSDFDSLKLKTHLLKTKKGSIYTYRQDMQMMQIPIDYINENASNDAKVLVVPEGAFINFITDRKSDNIHHNMDPLYYLDTFGEKQILEHFSNKNLMDYIVILPILKVEFGYMDFCSYAKGFCEMINTKYKLVKEEHHIKIYERK